MFIIVHPLVHRQSFQEHFVLFLDGVGHDLGGEEFLAVLAQGTETHQAATRHQLLLVAAHLQKDLVLFERAVVEEFFQGV